MFFDSSERSIGGRLWLVLTVLLRALTDVVDNAMAVQEHAVVVADAAQDAQDLAAVLVEDVVDVHLTALQTVLLDVLLHAVAVEAHVVVGAVDALGDVAHHVLGRVFRLVLQLRR